MEISISSDITKPELCSACEGNCGPEFSISLECEAEEVVAAREYDMYDCTE
jgi:hypothetical protein